MALPAIFRFAVLLLILFLITPVPAAPDNSSIPNTTVLVPEPTGQDADTTGPDPDVVKLDQ
jgi:hypothetical protein